MRNLLLTFCFLTILVIPAFPGEESTEECKKAGRYTGLAFLSGTAAVVTFVVFYVFKKQEDEAWQNHIESMDIHDPTPSTSPVTKICGISAPILGITAIILGYKASYYRKLCNG